MHLNMEFDLKEINRENRKFKELFIQDIDKNKKDMILQIQSYNEDKVVDESLNISLVVLRAEDSRQLAEWKIDKIL